MEEKRITLRLPAEAYASIEEWAERDVRSVNGEIVVLIREALAARQREQRQIEEMSATNKRPLQAA